MDESKGNSFANGPAEPNWLRHNWELRLVFEARTTRWDLDGSS